MHTARLTVDEALAGLRTARDGLAAREAERRAAEYGPNQVEETKREPAALRLARQFTHFFALILWIAAGLAFFAEAFEPGQGMATLGAAIVGVIALEEGRNGRHELRQVKLIRNDAAMLFPCLGTMPTIHAR